MVPESYRQNFRQLQKADKQSYMELASDKEKLFERWLQSNKVTTFKQLKEFMLVEEFKRSIPREIKLYVEREANTLNRAATLADNFALTHPAHFSRSQSHQGSSGKVYHNSNQGDRQNYAPNSQTLRVQSVTGSGRETDGKTTDFGKIT